VRLFKRVSVLLVAGATLSACATTSPEVAGMPSNLAWGNTLVTSSRAFTMAQSAGGGMPTDAIWNAVLEEDKIEIRTGTASTSQLGIDIRIGQLLSEAREAISSNDAARTREIGARIQRELDKRMTVYSAFEKSYAQKHPFKAIPDLDSQTHPSRGQGNTASPNCVVIQGQGWTGCAPQQ
jgi:hypothetical protein